MTKSSHVFVVAHPTGLTRAPMAAVRRGPRLCAGMPALLGQIGASP